MSRCTFLYGSLPYSIIHYALYMDTDPPKYSNAKHASAEYLNNFDIKPRNLTGNRFRSSCQVLNKMCYLCRQKRSLLNYQLQRMRMSDWDLRKWLQYVRIVYRIPLQVFEAYKNYILIKSKLNSNKICFGKQPKNGIIL